MDFLKYGGKIEKPIFKVMDLMLTNVLGGEHVNLNNFFISKNVINTKDEYLYFGQYTYIGEYFNPVK
jgi:hypothetical protein